MVTYFGQLCIWISFFFWSGSSFTWHSRITMETNLNSSQPLSSASIHLNIRTFKHSNQSLWAEYELREIFYILQWFSLEIWEILIYFYPSCMDHLSFLSAHQHLLIWNRWMIIVKLFSSNIKDFTNFLNAIPFRHFSQHNTNFCCWFFPLFFLKSEVLPV